ncbi:MAG: hypothetical protein PWP10_3961 [Clostridiales bacterium]|jgi:PHD/YefM family antitoxin component YafN of YafNO toxin-antitoxin module|nr:hypothetical protein [Clostridiales bacterium]
MPIIRPSSDIRNDYNGISKYCHENQEAVFITKNGKGDLAVMPIETYEKLIGKTELRILLAEGTDAIKEGNYRSADIVIDDLKKRVTK